MNSIVAYWLGCLIVTFAVMGLMRAYDTFRLWRSNRRYRLKQRYEPYRQPYRWP